MKMVDLLTFCHRSGGSDLHLSSGVPPMIRKDGELVRIKAPVLSAEKTRDLVFQVLSENQRKLFEVESELDTSFEIPKVSRFRINVFQHLRGIGAVFRTIPTQVPDFDALGCPDVLRDVARLERGLVLVTGPTGSGKSTTLAAMINLVNKERKGHILTIEDPVEFVHEPINCLINHREVGKHTNSFARALKAALREDPDIILVGEMRDLETIGLALTAAETGHLVFGTLHTSSAPKTVDRVIDVFPAGEQSQIRTMLATSLRAVIAQALMRKIGGGRVAAHEIMIGVPAISNLIREGKIYQIPSALQSGRAHGMQSLESSLLALVESKTVELEVAAHYAPDPEGFRKLVETRIRSRSPGGGLREIR